MLFIEKENLYDKFKISFPQIGEDGFHHIIDLKNTQH